jgi:hypothetical protein
LENTFFSCFPNLIPVHPPQDVFICIYGDEKKNLNSVLDFLPNLYYFSYSSNRIQYSGWLTPANGLRDPNLRPAIRHPRTHYPVLVHRPASPPPPALPRLDYALKTDLDQNISYPAPHPRRTTHPCRHASWQRFRIRIHPNPSWRQTGSNRDRHHHHRIWMRRRRLCEESGRGWEQGYSSRKSISLDTRPLPHV